MTNLRKPMNKRKIAAAVGGILMLLVIVGIGFASVKNGEEQNAEGEIFDTQTETQTDTETVAADTEKVSEEEQNAFLETQTAEEETVADDLRIHGFPYIKLTSQLNIGDYVDVRISFADGGDFVLLSKKQVQGMAPLGEEGANALWLFVSEEEILRLSSAVVDSCLNEGCSIYAVEYVSDTQKAAVVNYVVSDLVKQLMEQDPNITKLAENVQEYSLWKEYQKNLQRDMVYKEQEEILYMD